jgi:ankyrin repeat protein
MGHRQVAQLLLAAGAAVDLREKFGHTPLHFASDRGNLELVRMLLDAGADVSCTEHVRARLPRPPSGVVGA